MVARFHPENSDLSHESRNDLDACSISVENRSAVLLDVKRHLLNRIRMDLRSVGRVRLRAAFPPQIANELR